MNWFGRRAGREESRPALSASVSRSGVPLMGEWPRSYEAQVRESYLGNAVVQRAVKLLGESLAGAPIEGSDPALVALATARSEGQALLETLTAHLMLHGNAYIQVLRDAAGGAAELYALRPERVTVETGADGWPAAYRYRVGERVVRLSADPVRPEVIHVKRFHPLDDHYGAGCLGAVAGAVAIHNAAARWGRALLDNAARPSGALVHEASDGSALSAEQFARLKAEMEAFSGAGNAGRPMLLEGGLRWQAMSLSPAELDFTGTKAAAAREIALGFGVPPMLLGLPGDATYANYKEANKALWRLAILPTAGTIFASICQGLAGWFDAPRLRIDLDRVPAMAEDRERLWRSVSGATFLSDAEKRAMLDIPAVTA